ncbi:MAG: diacylglycerol kinase family protein [Caldilineaceae bacterium]
MTRKKSGHPPAGADLRALSGRDRGFWAGRWFSFKAALAGAWHTVRTQPNAWIELAALAVIGVTGWWFAIQPLEWALLGLTVFLVLALEAVNTAIEATIDLVSPHYHPLAKIAKDAAAGAMVFAVLGSLWVALAIFGPRLWQLFFG